jgi:hypothetical protein
MNRDSADRKTTETKEIDRILATEEALIPSSGFLASVMERVQEEAAAPAPIRFPWKRAIPGILLTAGVLGWGGYVLVREGVAAVRDLSFAPPHLAVALTQPLELAGWVAMALGASLLSWLLSRRLAGRSGLL